MEHVCTADTLRHRTSHSVETHGLDCGPYEHFYDEWYECACGEEYTIEEAEAVFREDDGPEIEWPEDFLS